MLINNIEKISILVSFTILITWGCVQQQQALENTEVVKNFYAALNRSDFQKATSLVLDSMRNKENGYTNSISKNNYYHWLEWDSVFQPTYQILEITEEDGVVKVIVSKECQRTLFLNGEPVVTREIIKVDQGKIASMEVESYEVFHNDQWNAKKEEVVLWVAEHHPELNGFIHDQTKKGAINYLKVIELYNSNTKE